MSTRRNALIPVLVVIAAGWTAPARAVDGGWTLVGWNDLGMHCMDADYTVFSILPPYTTIHAQLMDPSGQPVGADGGVVDGDVVVVTSKVVSKAEGRVVAAADREQAITDETVRVVATRERPDGGPPLRIVENRLGLVMAAAGVDASNTPEGTVLLLPEDPDASARALRAALRERFGARLAVVLTDTVGRPWREGLVDIAIGAAGLAVLDDLRGGRDAHGRELNVTVTAIADEVASAAELVRGKAAGRPVAVVRGLGRYVTDDDGPGAQALVRPSGDDLFREGSAEAFARGRAEGGRHD